jgi:GAF domain-containing protein/CheY-like chemotaxis protein
MSERTIRVLLLDDEESLRKHLSTYLHDNYDLTVDAVANGNKALDLIEEAQGHYDVALLDEALPEGPSGLEVLRAIKVKYPDIEAILFTGWGRQAGMEALRAGAYRYFTKLVDKDELAITIRFAAEQKRLRRERDYMAALVKVSHALTQTTNRGKQLNLVWDFVRGQLATPTCFVALYDPQTDTLCFPLRYDKGEPDPVDDLRLGTDQSNWGLAGYVVKTGKEQVWFTREQAEKAWQTSGLRPRVGSKGPSESGICLPLQVSDKILGALSVQSYKPYAFDQALLDAVRALGNQVTVALENSRLLNETNQKAGNLEALQNLAIAINSTLDLKQILPRTCQAAVELTGANHSGLVLFEPDLPIGKVIAEYPPTEKTLGQIITVRGIPAEERLVFEQKVINIPDLVNDTSLGSVRDLLLGLGIRSIAIVPVVFDNKVVASFSLDAMQEPRTFLQSEIEICQSLANQVAVAIRNARLFQETDEGRRYLHSLFEATTDIISPHDPNEVLQHIVDTACRTTGAWRAVALLLDESERPRILASSGFQQHLDAATGVRKDGVSMRVLKSGAAKFIPDAEAESDAVHPAMLDQGVKAAACLPLPLTGKNIGILWIHFRDKHIFSKTEQQALQLYANQSAIACDNARRMRELEQLRVAANAMASAAEWKDVLQEIAQSAKQVLGADYTLIWPYDAKRGEKGLFFPEDLVAEDIPGDLLKRFREEEPQPGSTTERVLRDGYVFVEDLSSGQVDFVKEKTRGILDTLQVKSFQGIRLDAAGEPLGVLFVDYKRARGFGEEDRRILEHFANHAALTLKKARLFEQVQRSRTAAQAVANVSVLGDIDKTLNATVEGTRAVLRCDIATVYSFDEENQRFVQAIGTGYLNQGRNLCPPSDINLNPNSAPWRIIRLQDKLYHLSEYALDDELLKGNFVKAEEVQSALGIQLRFGEHRVGVMFINYRRPNRFTEDEIQDALQFANQAALAIRNAQSYQAEQQYAQALEAIQVTSAGVSAILELDEMLPMLVNNAAKLFAAPAIGLMLWDKQEEDLIIRAAFGLSDEYQRKQRIPRSRVKEIVAERGLGPHIFDLRSAPIGDPKLVESEGLYNVLVAPLMIGEKLTGILNIYSKGKPRSFEAQEKRLAKIFANHAAIAIHNARRFGETERVLAARTALAWTGMIGSTWRHAIEKHAITIREQMQLLRSDLASKAKADTINKRLEMIERLANQILEKPMTPPLSAEEEVHSLPINDFLRERTKQLWAHEPYKSVTYKLDLKLDNLATVRASPEWLRRALDILIDNAVEATAESSERKITIGSQQRDHCAEISITDNGHGIPPEVLEQLFHEPIKKPQGAKGQGIGLLLAQMIVQTYGGTIYCRETGLTGTTMVVSLPLEM